MESAFPVAVRREPPQSPSPSLGLKLVGIVPCLRCRYVGSQTRRSIFVGFKGPWDYPSYSYENGRGQDLLESLLTIICPDAMSSYTADSLLNAI